MEPASIPPRHHAPGQVVPPREEKQLSLMSQGTRAVRRLQFKSRLEDLGQKT